MFTFCIKWILIYIDIHVVTAHRRCKVAHMVHILPLLLLGFRMYAAIFRNSGDNEVRTHDPLLARQVLSQLSYTPIVIFMNKIPTV